MKKELLLLLITGLTLSSCNKNMDIKPDYPKNKHEKRVAEFGSLLGEKQLFSNESKERSNLNLTCNSYLWKAALEVVSFMPITNTDPVSGIIITDWYQTDSNSNEKFKLNVHISGSDLRADNLQVKAFKKKKVNGEWINQSASNEFIKAIEEEIIAKARELNLKNKF